MCEYPSLPWQIERRLDGKPFGISASESMRDDLDVFCTLSCDKRWNNKIEAVARLLVAAPEMLEFIKRVAKIEFNTPRKEIHDIFLTGTNLIAKIEEEGC